MARAALSVGLALISFGYGSLTSFSALFADELGITPRSLFLTAMAVSILVGRLTDRPQRSIASAIVACCCAASSRRRSGC